MRKIACGLAALAAVLDGKTACKFILQCVRLNLRFKMTRTRIAAATAVAFALSIAQASADTISSTFDTGAEGWSALDPTGDYTASWQSTGGNPGGFLQGNESNPLGDTGYFIAPSKFLGNLSAYAGGTLTYDLKVIQGSDYFPEKRAALSETSAAFLASDPWSDCVSPSSSSL